jgi:UDP-N-acetylmuramoyl-L-alanyl-D-glutamate--2,6-diaminopimelate ligase
VTGRTETRTQTRIETRIETMTATLRDVADALPGASRRGDAVVTDATHDSRQVDAGALFCAIRGATTDGHQHAEAAAERGAAALLVDHWLSVDLPQLRVPDVRAATGPAAAVVHGHPSRTVRVVGITGTNGKTTTAYLVEAAAAAAGQGTGLVGTVESRIHGTPLAGVRTTPEGTDLQRVLGQMRDRDVQVAAIEVSSHGLALHRVDGTRIAVAVFTNLSHDHLDFHGSMQSYAATKARLFTPLLAERAVIDVQDDWGRWMAARSAVPTTTVGPHDADITRHVVRADLQGTAVVLNGPADLLGTQGPVEIHTLLVGAYNGRNASDAYLAAVAVGIPAGDAAAGIAACTGAPGRLERVEAGQPFTVFVDYAHTPEALQTVLATLRPLLPGGNRLLIVVGAGGDRDRAKRAPMGAAAAAADVAVLTSDNPRSEDPAAILEEVARGARTAGTAAEVVVELDRRAAIGLALDRARPGDVVLIAGKGHETTQEFADRVEPFDDRVEAARLLGQPPAEGAA